MVYNKELGHDKKTRCDYLEDLSLTISHFSLQSVSTLIMALVDDDGVITDGRLDDNDATQITAVSKCPARSQHT